MTDLDKLIAAAFASQGKQDDVNKVYLLLLRSILFVPTKKDSPSETDEPFSPLFAKIDGQYYLLAFDTLAKLQQWACDDADQVGYVELSGHDLIAGLNEQVYFCLNVGTSYYKEFSPDEVKRLKMIVSKIEQMKLG